MGREPGICPAQLTCPNTDTDHSDQGVPVLLALLFLEGRHRKSSTVRQITGALRSCSPNVVHMLKRWASWPRGVRWLVAGIAAVVVAAAVSWWLLVPATDWLARHDIGSAKGANFSAARDAARGRLLTLGAGLLAGGALLFTALNFNLLRRNSEQADQWQRRTHELTEQGQVTDRYTKAVEQLGSDKLAVRIGGIYALERVARDSERDYPTVIEVLTAFVREPPLERSPLQSGSQGVLVRQEIHVRRRLRRRVLGIDLYGGRPLIMRLPGIARIMHRFPER